MEVSASSQVSLTTRTATAVPDGRAGLSYPGIAREEGFQEAVYLCGLRQNAQDRSNVAFQHVGSSEEGPITLEITIYDGSGESQPKTESVTLGPRRWTQENGILGRISQGYVQVRKVSGNNPFITCGVINDGGRPGERSGDGAFLPARE